jgi:hypothetical protein
MGAVCCICQKEDKSQEIDLKAHDEITVGHADVQINIINADDDTSKNSSTDKCDNSMMLSSKLTGVTLSKSNTMHTQLLSSLKNFLAEAIVRYGKQAKKLQAHTAIFTESEGETAIYLGALDENSSMRSGYGVLYSNHVVKLGYWRDNELNGHAVLITDNNDVYEGDFEDGQITRGSLRTSEGYLYEGSFKNFKRSGVGRESLPDGSLYSGSFRRDLRHGEGKLNLNNGASFVGLFEKGSELYGEALLFDGSRYIGEWKDNKMHGNGKLTMTDGSVYQGQFDSGLKHGEGELNHNDGSSFKGIFEKGSKSKGTLLFKDGSKYIGEWMDNKMHGKGKLIKRDGTVFDGYFAYGMKHGKGQLMKKTGDIIVGNWERHRLVDSSMTPSQNENRRTL